MRRPILLLTASAALAACQVQLPLDAGVKKPAPGATKPAEQPASAPGATATPGAATPGGKPTGAPTPLGTPAPTGAALAKLARPATPVKVVAGKVLVDANYLVAAGAGNVISHNGSLIVAAGAGNVLSHNGSQLVAAGAGNVISHNGSQIVAAGAGNVISHNGSQIVAAGAGNVLSHNGSQLVGSGGNTYQLAQAATTPATTAPTGAAPVTAGEAPPPGTQLPAAGLALRARSLRDAKPLPLGVGPDGQPVYEIFTNAEGGYEVFLPASEEGNVLLEARVPEKTDVRLAYDLVADTRKAGAPPATSAPVPTGCEDGGAAASPFGAVIDEDTAVATRYLRTCLVGRIVEICEAPDVTPLVDRITNEWGAVSPAVREAVRGFVQAYRQVAEEAGLTKAPRADLEAIAGRCLETSLANADLSAVVVSRDTVSWWADQPPAPAIQEMVGVIRHARERTAERLKENAGFYGTWVFGFEAKRMQGFKPVKPSDVADFVVGEYLVSNDPGAFDRAGDVLDWSNALAPRPCAKLNNVDRLHGSAIALLMNIAFYAVNDPEVSERNFAIMRAYKPKAATP